ncbi:hypothetical protein MBLNU459_g5726t1 [Dothideomycetes sp. NU459]
MDASAYLMKHGWRGTGHSLDTSNNGLKRPLLISKKVDVLGVGINKHDVIADQWWLKAFDSGLRDFGTGKKSLLAQVKDHGIKRGGLYGRFVKGEGVPGTIGRELLPSDRPATVTVTTTMTTSAGGRKDKKRKAEDAEDNDTDVRKKQKKKTKSPAGASDSDSARDGGRRAAEKEARRAEKRAAKHRGKTLDCLPQDKRRQYELRAKEKGVSLERYFELRQAKNIAAVAAAA